MKAMTNSRNCTDLQSSIDHGYRCVCTTVSMQNRSAGIKEKSEHDESIILQQELAVC